MRYLTLLLLTACGGHTAPGHVQPQWADTAAEAQGTFEMRVYLGHEGHVRGLAVYHKDETRIPASVRTLGEKEFPGKTPIYFESEWHRGTGEVFEIEYDLGGGATGEVSARADGTLIYVEKPIALDALPPAVKSAALASVPGELKEAETKQGPTVDQIEVKIEHEGRTHVLLLTPAGEVVWHGLRFPAKVEVALPLR